MERVVLDQSTRAYVRQFEQIAKRSCAPLFWRDENNKLHNASMTFIRVGDQILGLTNEHVARLIGPITPESGITIQLGAARFDPGRLIAIHGDLDLASYEISDVLLAATRDHDATSVVDWPIPEPREDDILVIGGWPEVYRRPSDHTDEIEFGFAWVAGKINGRPGRNISIELRLETGTALSNDAIVPGDSLSGWSGGPIYRYVDTGLIEHIQLCGIVYESDPGSNVALGHVLTSLNEDGSFC